MGMVSAVPSISRRGILPPGRLNLATRPTATGLVAVLKTIGMVVVAALAARAEAMSGAAIRATFR